MRQRRPTRRWSGRGAAGAALIALFLACGADTVVSESVTLATYYPAPTGVYAKMLTTSDTFLARDGGSVSIGASGPPQAMLDVNGTVRVGNKTGDPPGAPGALYFNTNSHTFRGYDGSAWQDLGGTAGSLFTFPVGNPYLEPSNPSPIAPLAYLPYGSSACSDVKPLGSFRFCALSEVVKDGGYGGMCYLTHDYSSGNWTLHAEKDCFSSNNATVGCSASCF